MRRSIFIWFKHAAARPGVWHLAVFYPAGLTDTDFGRSTMGWMHRDHAPRGPGCFSPGRRAIAALSKMLL
jgi:hypothetical protein